PAGEKAKEAPLVPKLRISAALTSRKTS
ncbi:hypothetical protein SAMN05661103_4265, partial [Agrobacterium sp. 719_389]